MWEKRIFPQLGIILFGNGRGQGLMFISRGWEASLLDLRLSKSVRVFTQSGQYLLSERFIPLQLLLLLFWEKLISIIYVGTIHSLFVCFFFFFLESYPKPLSLLMRFQKIDSWIWVYKKLNLKFSISFSFSFIVFYWKENDGERLWLMFIPPQFCSSHRKRRISDL